MVAFSKVSSGRQHPAVGSDMLVAGAGASAFMLLPGQRSPGTAPVIPRVGRENNVVTSSHERGMGCLKICGTGLAVGLFTAAASRRSRQVHRKPIKVKCQKMSCDAPSGSMGQLFEAAGDVLAHPEDVGPEMVKRIQMLAAAQLHNITRQHRDAISEIMGSAQMQIASGIESQLPWTASAMATLLVASTCTVQPAHALDQVNYTSFLGEVQQGNVEMVRVQHDMLVAQYATKDGSRHEVNLVPNMSVEDSLFNLLVENKVDVLMQSTGTNDRGSLDSLARFAGPVAWVVAGLLLLFDNVTTGASNDFRQCMQVAQAMVMQLGMSDTVVGSSGGGGGPFMGRDFIGGGVPPVFQKLQQKIDAGVKRLVDEHYARRMELLTSNWYLLDTLAEKLIKQEKVGGEEFMKMINEAAAAGKLSAPLAVAPFVGEISDSHGKKRGCLHADKPVMFACADCLRRGNKYVPEAAAAFAGELYEVRKSRCLHPDKPVMFACSDCPRRSGKCSDEPQMAVASCLGEEVTDSKKSRCLHPDKPVMFACSDCPRRSGKCSDEPQTAVAAFLGEGLTDSKKSRCLHPDKPLMFACSDCPRRNGKCSDELQVAVAAFLAEEGTNCKKSRCLHPDKPVMFACSDCPRRSGKYSEESQIPVAPFLGEEATIRKKNRCLHPDKPVMFACSDCPRRSGKCSDEPQMAVAAFFGEERTDQKKSRCLHPDKPVIIACSDCPRCSGTCSDEPQVAVAALLAEEGTNCKKSRCLHPDKPVMFACGDCPRRSGKYSEESQAAVAAFLGEETTNMKKTKCLHPDKPVMFACSDCPRRSGKCSGEPQIAMAAFFGEEVTDSKKSRCLHPDKPVIFACSDCPRRGGKCAQGDEHVAVNFHLN